MPMSLHKLVADCRFRFNFITFYQIKMYLLKVERCTAVKPLKIFVLPIAVVEKRDWGGEIFL